MIIHYNNGESKKLIRDVVYIQVRYPVVIALSSDGKELTISLDGIESIIDDAIFDSRNEDKNKFKRGDIITSLDELASQEWIYIFDQIVYNGWFMSLPFKLPQGFLQRGILYYALPNDDRRKEGEGE